MEKKKKRNFVSIVSFFYKDQIKLHQNQSSRKQTLHSIFFPIEKEKKVAGSLYYFSCCYYCRIDLFFHFNNLNWNIVYIKRKKKHIQNSSFIFKYFSSHSPVQFCLKRKYYNNNISIIIIYIFFNINTLLLHRFTD